MEINIQQSNAVSPSPAATSNLLWLEDDIQEPTDQAYHGESTPDERAHGRGELVPMLALPRDHHGHRTDVVREASFRNFCFFVLHAVHVYLIQDREVTVSKYTHEAAAARLTIIFWDDWTI